MSRYADIVSMLRVKRESKRAEYAVSTNIECASVQKKYNLFEVIIFRYICGVKTLETI